MRFFLICSIMFLGVTVYLSFGKYDADTFPSQASHELKKNAKTRAELAHVMQQVMKKHKKRAIAEKAVKDPALEKVEILVDSVSLSADEKVLFSLFSESDEGMKTKIRRIIIGGLHAQELGELSLLEESYMTEIDEMADEAYYHVMQGFRNLPRQGSYSNKIALLNLAAQIEGKKQETHKFAEKIITNYSRRAAELQAAPADEGAPLGDSEVATIGSYYQGTSYLTQVFELFLSTCNTKEEALKETVRIMKSQEGSMQRFMVERFSAYYPDLRDQLLGELRNQGISLEMQ